LKHKLRRQSRVPSITMNGLLVIVVGPMRQNLAATTRNTVDECVYNCFAFDFEGAN